MKKMRQIILLLVATIGLAMSSSAIAGTDISSNVGDGAPNHWTKAGSPYHLKQQIYVLPGSTLTIDAGVVVANFVDDQGSLAVCRGAKIYVNGTKEEPVIMTSAEDVANWTGSVVVRNGSNSTVSSITTLGDSKTGIWLERCNDWGNLTIMGSGLISASHYGGEPVEVNNEGVIRTNTKYPDGLNQKQMEGLTAGYVGDSKVLYGGNNDDDDSGSISYLSIRYGGKVQSLAKELNGLSLGGIGRETDIHHVEIMNNVDDGIEIWGGTVNLKYINIWNIGDDSFDIDEGWRGKAQFGLIVQGYSADASQGSGVGDNCFETDGAEDSDAQPITTAAIYNFTAVGQPIDGDHGTAWRDNARVQYRNCILMNVGEQVVKFDGDDGDGASGYGSNGTLSWADTWTTDYTYYETANLNGVDPATLYMVQTDGKLAEISDSVFYQNLYSSAYTEATARGVLDAANNNITATVSPIQAITRGALVKKGGKSMLPVTFINPCAANDAVVAVNTAPEDGFFTAAPFRGGFGPYNNWLAGWTAVDAYGMTDVSMNTVSGTGDVNGDGMVDFSDLAVLSNDWLQVK